MRKCTRFVKFPFKTDIKVVFLFLFGGSFIFVFDIDCLFLQMILGFSKLKGDSGNDL
jgi:hypothetical protein